MTVGLRFFYRHLYITGLENIPAKGPAIIIANHNSSLMDAALLGILLKRKAWFFARGDVFVNRPVQKILWWLHMMPVHGHQGGRNTLNANSNSFSSGRKIVREGGIVVFFPESTSHTERRLLPFRKGVFRLAFDTAAAAGFDFDIPIIPVGICYEHPVDCRTTVQVHAGKPLQLLHYKKLYEENAAAALLQICRDAQEAIRPLVLHIDKQDRLQTAEQDLIISRNNEAAVPAARWKIASGKMLKKEMAICNAINRASDAGFAQKQQRAGDYFAAIAAIGLRDKTVCGDRPLGTLDKMLLLLGLPFFLLGVLLNGLPVLLARWIADHKVYRADFYSWIFVACCCCSYFIWLMLLPLLALFFWGWAAAGALLVTMIISGVFAYVYRGCWENYRQQKDWQALAPEKAAALKMMRSSL